MIDENVVQQAVRLKVVSDTFRRLTSDKKSTIYSAAIRLFGEYGYDGLSVDLLCQECRISKGSFFQYFPSKAHLLEFTVIMFDDYLRRWVAEIRAGDRFGLSRQRLLHLHEALLVNARVHAVEKRFYLFVTNALEHSAVRLEGLDLERHVYDYIREIVTRGEQTGEIRGDINIEITSRLVLQVFRGIMLRKELSRMVVQKEGAALMTLLFDGLKA